MINFPRYFDPRTYYSANRDFALLVLRNWTLLVELTRREFTSLHANQFFGPVWMIVRPMFVAVLYIFLFTVIFRTRTQSVVDLPLDHTAFILAGILPWLAFQTSMNLSCGLITGNAALLKDFIFNVELLPIRCVLTTMIGQLLGMALLLSYIGIVHKTVQISWVLLPLIVMLQIFAMTGVAFILAAFNVVVRDLQEIVQMFSTIGIFFTPIIYRPDWVPEAFRPILYANPFSYMVWCYHDVLIYGEMTSPLAWVVFPLLSVIVLAIGYRVFRYMKPHFGNFV